MRIVVVGLYKNVIESGMGLPLVWLKTKSGITSGIGKAVISNLAARSMFYFFSRPLSPPSLGGNTTHATPSTNPLRPAIDGPTARRNHGWLPTVAMTKAD